MSCPATTAEQGDHPGGGHRVDRGAGAAGERSCDVRHFTGPPTGPRKSGHVWRSGGALDAYVACGAGGGDYWSDGRVAGGAMAAAVRSAAHGGVVRRCFLMGIPGLITVPNPPRPDVHDGLRPLWAGRAATGASPWRRVRGVVRVAGADWGGSVCVSASGTRALTLPARRRFNTYFRRRLTSVRAAAIRAKAELRFGSGIAAPGGGAGRPRTASATPPGRRRRPRRRRWRRLRLRGDRQGRRLPLPVRRSSPSTSRSSLKSASSG